MKRSMPKILIVEDHKFTLDVVNDILVDENRYDIYAYACFPSIDFIKILRPDIILLDVVLQHKDGRRICEELRKDAFFHNVQIILFSAFIDDSTTIFACGADAFLKKPFDLDDLLIVIAQCLEKKAQKKSSTAIVDDF